MCFKMFVKNKIFVMRIIVSFRSYFIQNNFKASNRSSFCLTDFIYPQARPKQGGDYPVVYFSQ